MNAKTCLWDVKRVTGRNEFQSRTETRTCGQPVVSGLWCPKHNAKQQEQADRAKFKQAQRAARAAHGGREVV